MPPLADPYSEAMLSNTRSQIEARHKEVLSIGQDWYERLCQQLSDVEYGQGTPGRHRVTVTGAPVKTSGGLLPVPWTPT